MKEITSGTTKQFIDDINENFNSLKDYIVAKGNASSKDITWTYEKWNSGKAICYGKGASVTFPPIDSQWGSLYETATGKDFYYPEDLFIKPPICNITIFGSEDFESTKATMFTTLGYNTNQKTPTVFLLRPVPSVGAAFAADINIIAIGEWK